MKTAPQPPDDAIALAAAVRRGETTALDLMEASLAAADRLAHLGAVCRLEPDLGRDAARTFDALARRGSPRATRAAFGGVPFLMKDLGNAARGLGPVAGSEAIARRSSDPKADSVLARRFRRAGLVPFGLSTTPEFGLALTSEPPGGPMARNPWDPGRSAGGSSGGAAAAVAAGIVALAHGTDAAGSTRVPAACCGLVGMKPTRGATSAAPGFGNHLMGIAGELVVARSVRDVAAVLAAVSGDAAGPYPDPDLDAIEPTARVRIALVVDGTGRSAIAPAVAAAVERAGAALEAAGHRLVPIAVDRLVDIARRSDAHARTVLSASLAGWLDALGIGDDEVSPVAADAAAEGRRITGPQLFASDQDAALAAHALWRLFEKVDVIVTPMLSGLPPVVGAMPPTDRAETRWTAMAALAPYAALANVTGVPALAVPHGSDGGLPLGIQLVGPLGADRLLLSLAEELYASDPWSFPMPLAGLPS